MEKYNITVKASSDTKELDKCLTAPCLSRGTN